MMTRMNPLTLTSEQKTNHLKKKFFSVFLIDVIMICICDAVLPFF